MKNSSEAKSKYKVYSEVEPFEGWKPNIKAIWA